MDNNTIQTQARICPICFDDHEETRLCRQTDLLMRIEEMEEKLAERYAEVETLIHARKMAQRVLPLTREPRQPTGGMQTGDLLVVGLRDWHTLLRLARYLTPEKPAKGGKD